MKVLAFIDLDDTVFQTRAKCPPGELLPATVDTRGEPHSFMTVKQQRFLERLLQGATVIPTTGRSLAAFARVKLPFPDHVILNHGATILTPGGQVDEAWLDRTRAISREFTPELRDVHAALTRALQGEGVRVTIHADHDAPLYTLVKTANADETLLATVREVGAMIAARHPNLHAFSAGRAFTLIPRGLSKASAVREVTERHGGGDATLTLGVGDALSDTNFMSECDYALTPRGSQVLRALKGVTHVHP